MADIDVKLPDLGEDAPDEATMSFFYFEVGQEVEKDEDFADGGVTIELPPEKKPPPK